MEDGFLEWDVCVYEFEGGCFVDFKVSSVIVVCGWSEMEERLAYKRLWRIRKVRALD